MSRPRSSGQASNFDKNAYVALAPYGRPITTHKPVDKSSVLWRDFLTGVKRRKRLLEQIRAVATDENCQSHELKKLLIEMRVITLKVIEDALEIEYRSQYEKVRPPVRAGTALQLPPIASFRGLEGKEEIYMLADIITDTDDLYRLPNMLALLPLNFPVRRNPFMLGRDVDGIAALDNPAPEPGNMSQELKALEFLRYKRAAKTLLKAEVQLLNRMPLTLDDIEVAFEKMQSDANVNCVIRCVLTLLLDSNRSSSLEDQRSASSSISRGGAADLHYLILPELDVTADEFLKRLNMFHGNPTYPPDVQAAVRHSLRPCSIESCNDLASSFLVEWLKSLLGGDIFPSAGQSAPAVPTLTTSALSKSQTNQRPAIITQTESMMSVESSPDKPKRRRKPTEKETPGRGGQQSKEKQQEPFSPNKRAMRGNGGGKSKGKNDNAASSDELMAIRYQLLKMQQELLKKRVLDVSHFRRDAALEEMAANPQQPDILDVAADGTAGDTALSATILKAMENKEEMKLTSVISHSITVSDTISGRLDLSLDHRKHTLYVRYVYTPILPVDPVLEKAPIAPEQTAKFVPLDRLLFNHITGMTMEDMPNTPEKLLRNQLNAFFKLVRDQLKKYLPVRDPRFLIPFDVPHTLVTDVISPANAAMDVTVSRNNENTGVAIHIQPQKGALKSGNYFETITLFLHDKELLVLLINQRGLYHMAQSKWSCMEMIAQWLLTRLHVNRYVLNDSAQQKIGRSNTIYTEESAKEGAYFEVDIDRSVDISEEVKSQWMKRNVPHLADVTTECTLSARQDLEMLYIDITITLRYVSPSLIAAHQARLEAAANDAERIIVFTHPYNDGFDDDQSTVPSIVDFPKEEYPLEFNFGLTGEELLVFGSCEVMADKKVAGGIPAQDFTSNTFMKNVLSRLFIKFKGSKTDPLDESCSAADDENWDIRYNRRLLRDVRTISGGVCVLTASAIGGELLFEAKPTDNSVFPEDIGSKLFTESELSELAIAESWNPDILEPASRVQLAYRVLEKLKIIQEHETFRLENLNFPESRMLPIVIQGSMNKQDLVIGVVEIYNHMMLADLRLVMTHELDRDLLPKQFRFIYRGSPCAVRQEVFRKAWECLPRCFIVPKIVKDAAKAQEKPKEEKEKISKIAKKKAEMDMEKAYQLSKQLVAVPIPTLCMVQENCGMLYTRHDMRGILNPGDIVRIGHHVAAEYVIPMGFVVDFEVPLKTIPIQPYFCSYDEVDQFIIGNSPWPKPTKKGDMIERQHAEAVLVGMVEYAYPPLDASRRRRPPTANSVVSADETASVAPSESITAMTDLSYRDDNKEVAMAAKRTEQPRREEPLYIDVWIWKCIPRGEDRRPRWRILYDNGKIQYKYTHQDRKDGPKYFRIQLYWQDLERMVRDVRCSDFCNPRYAQRATEMERISVDYYTTLSFKKITEWYPPTPQRIDFDKFMKLLKEIKVFPDIQKANRIMQIQAIFDRELKSVNAIDDKYISYEGYLNMLQDVALIRFPPGMLTSDGAHAIAVDENDEAGNGIDETKTSAVAATSPPKKDVRAKEKEAAAALARDGKRRKSVLGKGAVDNRPEVDPAQAAVAFRKLITDYVMTIPEWAAAVWEEAKLFAMDREARRHAAVTRIAAAFRGAFRRYRYKVMKKGSIAFQSHVRRRIAARRVKRLLNSYIEDWLFRIRYNCAIKAQSAIRRFIHRTRYLTTMARIREKEVIIQRARRQRLSKLREKERKGIVFKQIRRINGIIVLLILRRKDSRNYTNDFGLVLEVYTPSHQEMIKFVIEEADLRKYMQDVLRVESLSLGELYNKNHLEKVVSARLICRQSKRFGGAPKMILSRQALGQKGPKMVTKGRVIGKDMFVCALFETGYDVVVQCYHPKTSNIFTATILTSQMTKWITDTFKEAYAKDDIKRFETPDLLRPENKADLHSWLVEQLVVDKRHGQFKVMFACQYQRSRKMECIIKLQAVFRRVLVRMRVPYWLDSYILKVKSGPYDETCYYINQRTGESSWYKPSLLHAWQDLPTQPIYHWVLLKYHHDYPLYVNPYTGKYTHLTTDRAVRIMQSLVRQWLLRAYRVDKKTFAKGVAFEMESQRNYERERGRLACILNYALVALTIMHDDRLTKRLLQEALELADTNPLTTRLYAIYLLSSCESPLQPNRERAMAYLRDATVRDRNTNKFHTARACFFKYACYRQPKNVRTLLNLGLVEYYVYKNFPTAEIVLRRAVALAPFDERVLENWKLLRDSFPEKQLVYRPQFKLERSGQNSKRVTLHGRIAVEDSAWAGWVFVEREVSGEGTEYWYNPATGEERPHPPDDFHAEWEVRARRSHYEGEKDGLERYFDPLTASYFQRHVLTDTYV